ncbi:MAG: 2-amino-4-hydroxy-6-hydroxymethyldihydropteridine diphosphokinase [Alphaproteobacteria bacterium]|nr:2-amino-4-hydroxy-6-hydroxymethyldihydropteridine diphosphokinase [Alphaproteobacteria bacterium]
MILVGLGANLDSRFGTPPETLAAARDEMERRGLRVLHQSSLWLTAPVPLSDQPWYHNQVVSVESDLPPETLLVQLQAIESAFGRVRSIPNAPRLLDLDLIVYGRVTRNDPSLTLPHPRMHERAFVLRPMRERLPGTWRHPVSGQTLDEMIADLPPEQEAHPLESCP